MTQTKETRTTIRLMKALTSLIGTLSAKDLAALAGELEKRASAARSSASKPASSSPDHAREDVVEKTLELLKSSKSRDEGYDTLDIVKPTRRELADMAARLDVYVAKEDNIARVAEKVIGAAIGSRLSSQAIRGETAKVTTSKD